MDLRKGRVASLALASFGLVSWLVIRWSGTALQGVVGVFAEAIGGESDMPRSGVAIAWLIAVASFVMTLSFFCSIVVAVIAVAQLAIKNRIGKVPIAASWLVTIALGAGSLRGAAALAPLLPSLGRPGSSLLVVPLAAEFVLIANTVGMVWFTRQLYKARRDVAVA